MYEKHFNLAELPFRITADPHYLWYSEQHLEAKEKIFYHVTQSIGPIYLLAQVGTGKTTIAKRIGDELAENARFKVVFVYAPKLTTTNAFLRFVMDEFEVKTDRAYARSLKNFEQFLIEQQQAGVSPVLLIDEAQNMTRDMLLLIQHLFNFSTDTRFLVQVAMFAQPELQPKLDRLTSLQSRLGIAKLKPFDLAQTREMLLFRWHVAGGQELPFSSEAIGEMYEQTGGVPRLIVKLAHEALVRAAVAGLQQVDRALINAAAVDLTPTVG